MDETNLDTLSELMTKVFEYLGCCQSNHQVLQRQMLRSMCKAKSAGDIVLPFREYHDQNVRLCIDGNVVFNAAQTCDDIGKMSKDWTISISTCEIVNGALSLSLNRKEAFAKIIHDVIEQGENYGKSKCHNYARIRYACMSWNPKEEITDLTEIRVALAAKLVGNLLATVGYEVEVNPSEHLSKTRELALDLYFTHKSTDSSMPSESKCVPCGVVLNSGTGCKEKELTGYNYFRQWEEAIFKAYQEKYNIVTRDQLELEAQIAKAGVLFDLLSIKLNNCVSLAPLPKQETRSCYGVNSKGAPFVLYNTARLANLNRQFQMNVDSGKYPELPQLEEIDMGLLTYEEEWSLVFHYVSKFPLVIKESLIGCDSGKPNTHVFLAFLNDFCKQISVYYRRVRILTDSRSQLLPTMYARLYLLKSIEQVLHNALSIVDVRPILQM